MPRKGHIAKRGVEADPVYGSDLVTKFVNSMMWSGKKSTAEGIFYEALTRLQQKGGRERQAVARGENPARWRRQLSGAGGSEPRSPHIVGYTLAYYLLPRTGRERNDR